MKRIGFIAAFVLSATGCRPGEGERCFCEGDCRGGTVCAVAGAVLPRDRCIDSVMASSIEAGVCIDGDGAPSSENDLNPPPFLDLGPWATETTPVPPGPSTSAASTDATETDTTPTTTTDTPMTGSSSGGSTAATDASTGSSSGSGGSGGSTSSTSGSGSESTTAGG